jgi:hypothetical protein
LVVVTRSTDLVVLLVVDADRVVDAGLLLEVVEDLAVVPVWELPAVVPCCELFAVPVC